VPDNFDVDSLYVIVVNWNLPQDTIACVNSLFAAGAQAGHVIVVDNGSSDDSLARIEQAFGAQVRLIPSPANLGFAGGNNLAIAAALERGAEWIMLANNDTIVAPDLFAALHACAAANPQIKLLAPLILYSGEPHRIWSLGDRRLGSTLLTRSLLRDAHVPAVLEPLIEVDFLNACGLLVHRSVFEAVGLFDTAYFMYGEDVDFFRRVAGQGFRLGCCTGAHMWHKVSRSTGVRHPQGRYWRVANQIKFYRMYSSGPHKRLLMIFTALRGLRLWLGDLRAGQGDLGCVTLRAWLDGWFG
jgi:GT2 family glycosyltransferase